MIIPPPSSKPPNSSSSVQGDGYSTMTDTRTETSTAFKLTRCPHRGSFTNERRPHKRTSAKIHAQAPR
ncbi:histidine utilization repressor [Sesbania bispinosa]|nr:histidine utilization repressor [Sesbania bispinosa]